MKAINFTPSKLKELRDGSNLSVDKLMVELNNAGLAVSRNTIINWENGATEPDPTDLCIIASFYKKPIQFFFQTTTK